MSLDFDEDIVLAKLANIDEALDHIETVTARASELEHWMVQDLCALYLQRAVEAQIDVANHLIAANGWSTPTSASEAFEVLTQHEVFDADFTEILISMVGFRNIAVHAYGTLDPDIVDTIVADHLDDFRRFSRRISVLTVGASS